MCQELGVVLEDIQHSFRLLTAAPSQIKFLFSAPSLCRLNLHLKGLQEGLAWACGMALEQKGGRAADADAVAAVLLFLLIMMLMLMLMICMNQQVQQN